MIAVSSKTGQSVCFIEYVFFVRKHLEHFRKKITVIYTIRMTMFLAFSFDIQSSFAWMTPEIPTYTHWQLPEHCFILLVKCLWADTKQIPGLLT